MSSTTNELFQQVDAEIARARFKFPANTHLTVALTEEVGELAQALLEKRWGDAKMEAVQVMAVAARIYLEGDADLAAEESIASIEDDFEYQWDRATVSPNYYDGDVWSFSFTLPAGMQVVQTDDVECGTEDPRASAACKATAKNRLFFQYLEHRLKDKLPWNTK